ncbi:MAG TPA: Na+/H+ antiporter subunit E [Thermoanaerobaculia bacterium]
MSIVQAFLWNVLLAVFWALASGRLTLGSLATGFIAGLLVLLLTRRAVGAEAYLLKFPRTLNLILYFVYDLITANLRLARDVVRGKRDLEPAIIAIPIDAESDGEITLLASLITLTPGTLTLDVSRDRKTIFIHSMYAENVEEVRRRIKEGLEHKILRVTR